MTSTIIDGSFSAVTGSTVEGEAYARQVNNERDLTVIKKLPLEKL
jgi:hypothetical protein